VAQAGVTKLESGEPTPGDPDGTAAFVRRGGNGSVLVDNHEISGSDANPVPRVPGFTYDPAVGGGTTNIEVDKGGNRVREYVSLAGMLNNCAGGKTPWETWLTCEEAESLSAAAQGLVPQARRRRRHAGGAARHHALGHVRAGPVGGDAAGHDLQGRVGDGAGPRRPHDLHAQAAGASSTDAAGFRPPGPMGSGGWTMCARRSY
jgi:secreted PhoX family phosphatase